MQHTPDTEVSLIDIDKVIEAKSKRLHRLLPRPIVSYIKRIIHQDDINQFLIRCKGLEDFDFADAILRKFGARISVSGLENVPADGRYIFASNHPLGGLDGILFIAAVGQKFRDIKFPVNDILLYLKGFRNIFLPVNKTGVTGRRAAELMEEAFASPSQILMFPAGLCSRRIGGRIVDLDWKKGFVGKAVSTHRDVVPVLISGANSSFFYNLSTWRKRLGIKFNIEMLYLVDEMYKQYDRDLSITFGRPIAWQQLEGRKAVEVAQQIKQTVYSMGGR